MYVHVYVHIWKNTRRKKILIHSKMILNRKIIKNESEFKSLKLNTPIIFYLFIQN